MTRRLHGDAKAAPGSVVSLSDATAKHVRVLRLGEGTIVELFDGEGHLAEAELLADGRARIRRTWEAPAPEPRVTLVWGVPKPAAVDTGIRMATELGVDVIRIALAERSPRQPSEAKVERWRRVAREATRQSERATTPTVEPPAPLLDAAAVDAERRLGAFARAAEAHASETSQAAAPSVAIAVGPEGGFTEAEQRALETELGYRPVTLGPHVLRSETAAATAVALVRAGVLY